MGSRINNGKPRNSSLTQAIVLFFFPRARERKRKNFFPQPYPFTLAVNISPAVFSFFFITRVRRTLKRTDRGSVNRLPNNAKTFAINKAGGKCKVRETVGLDVQIVERGGYWGAS